MSITIPATMKRLELITPHADPLKAELLIREVPVPKPKSGEVLIKVIAAAVNPSDTSLFKPHITPVTECPKACGREGCGIVVASGGGCCGAKIGAKLGFCFNGAQGAGQGSWSEYVVMSALKGVFPIPDDVPCEAAASCLVNPFTTLGILDTVRRNTTNNTFVHLAAASQLGQMMVKKVNAEADVTLINVVRRPEQAELLRSIGAKHVVVTGKTDDWKEELHQLMKKLSCTCVLDPVAGPGTGELIDLLPYGGKLFVYGGLAGPISGVRPDQLIYQKKEINGFYLSNWIASGGMLATIRRVKGGTGTVMSGISGGWSSTSFQDTTMEAMMEDFVKLQAGNVTSKLRIRFDQQPAGQGK